MKKSKIIIAIFALLFIILAFAAIYVVINSAENDDTSKKKTEFVDDKDKHEKKIKEDEDDKEESDDEVNQYIDDVHAIYMQGFKDGTFGADQSITRAEIATILARLSAHFDESEEYEADFEDVSPTSWNKNYIGFCIENYIITGYKDGTFKPKQKMTRAEFAVAIVRFSELPYIDCKSTISDVRDTWCEQYFGILHKYGYITPDDENKIYPNQEVTRSEVCHLVNKVLNRIPEPKLIDEKCNIKFTDLPKTHKYYYDVLEAAYEHSAKELHTSQKTNGKDSHGVNDFDEVIPDMSNLNEYTPDSLLDNNISSSDFESVDNIVDDTNMNEINHINKASNDKQDELLNAPVISDNKESKENNNNDDSNKEDEKK